MSKDVPSRVELLTAAALTGILQGTADRDLDVDDLLTEDDEIVVKRAILIGAKTEEFFEAIDAKKLSVVKAKVEAYNRGRKG